MIIRIHGVWHEPLGLEARGQVGREEGMVSSHAVGSGWHERLEQG